jgi:hypothetical protein
MQPTRKMRFRTHFCLLTNLDQFNEQAQMSTWLTAIHVGIGEYRAQPLIRPGGGLVREG